MNGFFNADMAFRQGKVLIQNAEDFYASAKQTEENGSKIKYLFYNQEDVDNGDKILQEKKKNLCRLQEHSGYTL